MQFYSPEWLILLWLIPLLVLFFVFSDRKKKKLLSAFGQLETVTKLTFSHSSDKSRLKTILFLSGTILLIVALAQPQWGQEKKQLTRKGIDLMFMVDTSLSMLAEDVKPSRIEKAKFLMKTFLKHLRGDRVGIVTFAGSGFLQSPLTLDYSAFSLFANSIQVGYIPDLGTNLSDGIQIATQSFPKDEKKYKAIIVLSDGEEMEGHMEEAIEAAKKSGARIYTIGIGTSEGEPIPLRSSDGKINGYKKDRQGQIVITKLNEALLQKIAKETEGLYFQATPSEVETDLVYQHLQNLGKKELKEKMIIEREDRYQSFLLIGFLFLVIDMLLGDRKRHAQKEDSF